MASVPKILPPQNSPVFDQNAGGVWSMTRPWVQFFQALYGLALQLLTKVSGGFGNFASFAPDGSLFDSGYDGNSFLKISDMPVNSVTTGVITAITGGTPNLQQKSRSVTVTNGLVTSIGAESAATDIKPKAYEDIALGLQASPSGISAPNLVAWNGTNISVYGFNGTTTMEQLFGVFEYNHNYKEGADIYPHIHWSPTTTATTDVKWNLDYVWDNVGAGPSAVTTISVIQAANGVAYRQQKALFPTISGTGKQIGSQIQFRLWRDPTDVQDTYAAIAVIQTMGIHAEIDSFGSTNVSSK